jgi:hypothetical protein
MNTVRPHTEDEIYDILKQALDAVREAQPDHIHDAMLEARNSMTLKTNFCPDCGKRNSGIHTCSPAYAVEKAEKQKPVAWISPGGHIHFDPYLNSIPLYTTPPAAQLAVQKPVAWINAKGDMTYLHGPYNKDDRPLVYETTPPSAQRQPLTNGEIYTAYITATNKTLRPQDERLVFAFARAIEAAHGIKEQA